MEQPQDYEERLGELQSAAIKKVQSLWGKGMVKITPQFQPEDVAKVIVRDVFKELARDLEIAQLELVIAKNKLAKAGIE